MKGHTYILDKIAVEQPKHASKIAVFLNVKKILSLVKKNNQIICKVYSLQCNLQINCSGKDI